MRLRCQICGEWIAECNASFLSFPMTGAMFTSPDTHHGVPAPFPSSASWEDFRCPWGQHRPMIFDNQIQTDQGLITLSRDGSPVVTYKRADELRGVIKDLEVQDEQKQKRTTGQKQKKGVSQTCETCGKEFEKEINLKRHIRMAHKEA